MAAEENAQENSSESSSEDYCPEYNALRDTTSALCCALPIKDLIPLLISAHVIDFTDRDDLCEGNRSGRKVTEFFISKHLSRSLKLGNTRKFKKFMAVIQHSGKCDELFDKITERIEHHQQQHLVRSSGDSHVKHVKNKVVRNYATNKRETAQTSLTNWFIVLLACAVITANSKLEIVVSSYRPGINLLQVNLNFQVGTTHEPKTITKENNHYQSTAEVLNDKNLQKQVKYVKMQKKTMKTLKFKHVHKIGTSSLPSWLHDSEVIRVFSNYAKMLKTAQKDHAVGVGEPFIVSEGGYQMAMTLCPSGCGDGEGTHLSVYLHLMKGPHDDELEQAGRWPLSGVFKIELLNQFSDEHHYTEYLAMDENVCKNCTNKMHLENKLGHRFGRSRFYPLSNLSNTIYLQNDSLYFRVSYQRYYFNFLFTASLPEVYFVMMISIYNWLAVSLLLMLTEFVLAFCLKDTELELNIVDHQFPFGSVRYVLLTEWHVMAYTWWTVFCKTLKNFLLFVTLMILGVLLLVAAELIHSDMSSVEDRHEVIVTILRRISQVLIWSMTVETYKTFWGGSFIMISPIWIIHLL